MANESPSDPSFHFPFTPYDIQLDLMKHVYSSLAKAQVTVIESPTGTGKSLSLISSTFSWLSDSKERAREDFIGEVREGIKKDNTSDDPDWVVEADVQRKVDEFDLAERELEVGLELIREKERRSRGKSRDGAITAGILRHLEDSADKSSKRRKIDPDEEFAPEPYEVDQEEAISTTDNYSSAVRELLKSSAPKAIHHEVEEPDVRKIFFASRTHSQLAQFIGEIRKTYFAQSSNQSDSSTSILNPPNVSLHPIRVIPLGSRENLCINDAIKQKHGRNNDAIGDACLELQKATKEKRCPHLPPMTEPERLNNFRDQALASIHTITDIEELGRKLGTCPYYGSRKAVRSAEIVTLPYNMLMQKSAREALGISLKDHIVVIDEAHNLIDTVLSLHSISISRSSVWTVQKAIKVYAAKFKSRLNGGNLIYLAQLVRVLEGIGKFADEFSKGVEKESLKKVGEVLSSEKGGALDSINLLKLDEYLRTSRIARKIGSYVDKLAEEKTTEGRQVIRTNATKSLQHIQSFIVSLVNATSDGRVLLSKEIKNGVSDVHLKYLLLAPSEAFKDIVDEARSLVLAGGTMKPISDFRTQLFPYLPLERYSTFSCGHVVPQVNIKTFAISVGPAPKALKLDFKAASRTDEMIDELASAITKISFVVPKGIVIFLPSYAFLKQVQDRCSATLVKRLASANKTIFWEPTDKTAVDSVLIEYKKIIMETTEGAILFAVVNAKLSEGINFEDDMARAVIICGIPYPNKFSTELSARMNYLNTLPKVIGEDKKGGDTLYDNLAFRGVNQSIGRAFRHANDWAAIILLDERYSQKSIQNQLPDWLGSNVESPTQFGTFVASLSNFCRARKKAMMGVI